MLNGKGSTRPRLRKVWYQISAYKAVETTIVRACFYSPYDHLTPNPVLLLEIWKFDLKMLTRYHHAPIDWSGLSHRTEEIFSYKMLLQTLSKKSKSLPGHAFKQSVVSGRSRIIANSRSIGDMVEIPVEDLLSLGVKQKETVHFLCLPG